MSDCIDLNELFADRYLLAYEESYNAARGERGRGHDPWLLTIPCQHGHIYPHGGDLLAASTNNRGAIAKRLAALPRVRIVQDGDDGVNVVFQVSDFDNVAVILKPKRRRRLSPEHRATLIAAGKAALDRHRNSNGDSAARTRVPASRTVRRTA